jgi:hypothetical protein
MIQPAPDSIAPEANASVGVVQPHSLMLEAIAAIWASEFQLLQGLAGDEAFHGLPPTIPLCEAVDVE